MISMTVLRSRSWILGISVLLAVMLAVAPLGGCSLNQLKTEAAQVSQLVISSLSDPKTFNVALSQEQNDVFGFINEGLITENGVTGELEPALAKSWEISNNNQRIVYTLREGLKWSDGEPLTAEDVVFTYNDVYLNEKIPTDTRDVLRIGETGVLPTVRKLNDLQVEFTIPEPFAPFLRVTGIGILPAHTLRQSVTTFDSAGNPTFLSTWGTDTNPKDIVVAGPYQIESYSPSQRVVLRRNPYYWRRDAQGNPLPYIEQIVLQVIESLDADLLQFRSGGLDVTSVSPEYFALLKRQEEQRNYAIHSGGPTLSMTFISFNLNKGQRNGRPLVNPIRSRWFNTLAFRQAVNYAIDRQTMLNNIFQGIGELQNSPIASQSPYYLSPEEGLKVYDYNPERARELLLGAGFKYGNEGQLLDADGNRVRFSLITNAGNKTREAMGAQIQRDFSKVGIQVDFNPIAFNTLAGKLSDSLDFECFLLSIGGGGFEPNSGANTWLPDGGLHAFNQSALPGQTPIVGREVTDWEREIGQLYIKGAQELDEAKRKAIYGETQRLAQEYLPFIYLVNPLSMAAVRDRVQGVQYSALGGSLWNIYELKVTEK